MLDGTEVFHARCVGQSYRSALRLAEAKARELQDRLDETRRAAARVEAEANRLRNEVASQRQRVIEAEARSVNALALADNDRGLVAALRQELADARAREGRLRAELVALRPQEAEATDDRDATVERFRLLELD